MNKDVLVSITGTQMEYVDSEENDYETVEVVNPATYFFKDGLHYIFFEEVYEGTTSITKNKIIFKENDWLEVVKKGVMNSNMKFQIGEYHENNYETPYGEMLLGVKGHKLEGMIDPHNMTIKATYELIVNCDSYAECEIVIRVTERSNGME